MTVTSFNFLLFLGILTIVYYVIPKKFQWILLLLASYFFYLTTGIKQVIFIVVSTCLTYAATIWMQKIRVRDKAALAEKEGLTREEKREFKKQTEAKINKVKVAAILIHLGILAAVKYLNVTIEDLNGLFGLFKWDAQIPTVKNIIVPLGISFFTFASIGYIIDVARGKYEPEKNIFKVALFVSYFPSIIQGPINRFDDVGTQLFQEHKFDYDRFVSGAELMLWGFFKKLVIADRAVNIVTTVFGAEHFMEYSGSQYLFGIFIYFFQIYGDFSGGIDICRGASEILGVDLPLNFERPAFATSVEDFWRRWHITLGGWMRDYVFYPVMLSKPVLKLSSKANKRFGKYAGKMVPSTITPFVVFFLMGIWHGADYQHILYALYNAFMVSAAVAITPLNDKIRKWLHVNTEVYSYKVICMVRVFIIMTFSRLIVKTPGVHAFLHAVKSIFTNFDANFLFGMKGELYTVGLDAKNMFVLFVAIIILTTVSVIQECGINVRERLNKQNLVVRWFLLLALFVFIVIFGAYGKGYDAASFIYQAY